MSSLNPLASEFRTTSDDPWSGYSPEHEPSTTPKMNGSSHLDDANGGASASMHAPSHIKASLANNDDRSGFPSSSMLSTRLPRVGSSFGSKGDQSTSQSSRPRPAFNPFESESLSAAWGLPTPKDEHQKSLETQHTHEQPVPAAPNRQEATTPISNGFKDPLSDTADAYQQASGPLLTTREQISQNRTNLQSMVARSDPLAEAQAAEAEHYDDDDDENRDEDEDEAFVYPTSATDDATQTDATNVEASTSASVRSQSPLPVNTLATPNPESLGADQLQTETSEAAQTQATAVSAAPESLEPAPIDYDRLTELCSRGSLADLQAFVEQACSDPPTGSAVSMFALANDPNPSNGLVPLHFAAREGKTDIVKWLVSQAGAIVEMEDREGETALHKAAMTGKLSVITFLLANGADADAKDSDGWTALHNASSRGYLDIVRLLVDSAQADVDVQGGRGGWTPLMNAASKGHLPVVRQLISKYHADPFIRNASGETAFDIAAATFEVYICEVLERYEAERWNASKYSQGAARSSSQRGGIVPGHGPYDPLTLHTTVPVIVHENQRLDTRLQTLAMHGGKPRWSSSSAARPHKPDRRSPSSMPPGPLSPSRTKHSAMRREDVLLPTRAMPYRLRLRMRTGPAAARRRLAARNAASSIAREDDLASTPTPESVLRARGGPSAGSNSATAPGHERDGIDEECSHFWLSEWQIDTTHPLVDVGQGWQYAKSFDALDDKWSSQPPPPLERLLEGRGLSSSVTRALTGGSGLASSSPNHSDQEATSTGWVRRRRWIRVMRRRLDIEFGDALEACESSSHAVGLDREVDGLDPAFHSNGFGQEKGNLSTAAIMAAQEAARNECAQLGADADYVSRARALAGSSAASGATPADALGEDRDELARRIARLVMAITELRAAFEDDDIERRTRAEDLRKEFVVQLGQLREAAGLGDDDDNEADDEDDDDDFIYPNSYKDDGASVFTRLPSVAVDPATAGPSTSAGPRPPLSQRQSSAASMLRGSIAPSEAGTSAAATRSADLAANRSFRVPTNEAPNKVTLRQGPALREQNLQPQWERDEQATDCRGCGRRFTFFLRKHHCRRCGRIFCDPCSSNRAQLSMQDLVVDPSLPGMAASEAVGPTRICNNCHAEMQLPPQLQSSRGADALMPSRSSLTSPRESDVGAYSLAPPSDVSSRASELTECPVCSKTLATLGGSEAQEAHVRNCLENGGGGSVQGGRYLVYKLPETSPIVGKECSICMEDFVANSVIARLPCLCYFHRGCIDSWFKRGRECPVHARSW